VQQEFRNYVWAKDKDDNYINMPEDHDNHCVDAIRYFINGHILGQIVKPRRISSDQLGIF
jgi:phage terminase large subunit